MAGPEVALVITSSSVLARSEVSFRLEALIHQTFSMISFLLGPAAEAKSPFGLTKLYLYKSSAFSVFPVQSF